MTLFKVLGKKYAKGGSSQLQNYHVKFHILHALLSTITIRVRLDYHKFCEKWIPKMTKGAHKTQRIPSALIFRAIRQRW
jgi:hypothetical protein